MRARWLLNLLLLLIVIGFAVLYLTHDSGEDETPTLLSDLDSEAITHLRVERPNEPVIELERVNGDWRLIAPIEADADDGRVESILHLPESVSESRFAASDQNLEKYGLEPPKLTVEFDEQRFVIGDTGALDQKQRYVLYQDQVHLISGRLHQRLSAPLTYYVNPELIPADHRITRIRLPDGVLSRIGEEWRVIPGSLTDTPAEVIDGWKMARAVYVKQHDTETADYEGDVDIEFENAETLQYRLMQIESQYVLANPALGLQYHLDRKLAQQLLLAPAGDDGAAEDG